METVVRLSGVVETILGELVQRGFFKTKSEAIRAGVLGLGKEYHLLEELQSDFAYAKEFDRRVKSGELELGTESELKSLLRKKKSGD
ncbi:hypothetical protein HY992_04350 [Candidatus Micrarchaeota archaeon]|nr:hypothetical protein [Candidatus Micrarchaeota archaeon]